MHRLLTQHTKNQKNVANPQGKRQSVERIPKGPRCSNSQRTTTLKQQQLCSVRKICLDEKTGDLSRETETIQKKQMEILKLKSLSGIKTLRG